MATAKDYLIWFLFQIILKASILYFNVLKFQNVIENGHLKPRKRNPVFPRVKGSLYQEYERLIQQGLDKRGDWVFLRDGLTGKKLKVSEYVSLAKRLSIVLKDKGFTAGDTIHIVTGNHYLYFPLVLSAWRLGGSVSCGDIALSADTIRYQIEETKSKLVVHDGETKEKVEEALADNHLPIRLSLQKLEELVALADEELAQAPEDLTGCPSETCAQIFWSSGTTGQPKGICHSHQSLFNAFLLHDGQRFPPVNDISTLHFFHMGGFMHPLTRIIDGGTCTFVFKKEMGLKTLLDKVIEYRPSFLLIGSHHYVQLSEVDLEPLGIRPADLSSVKLICPTGAAVPRGCANRLRKRFPLSGLHVQGLGSTEVWGISGGFMEFQGLGALSNGLQSLKIVNPDTRELCDVGEVGEICTKTYTTMIGYLNKPKSAYFDEDGFGKTGDLGYFDRHGGLYYVDRMKEVIKYCNNHVAPTELEDIIQDHPAVKECLVFGIKEPAVQELVSAVVVLREGESNEVDEDDIRRFVESRVDADYKRVRGKVIFRDTLPRNTMGKLLRREMRKWAEEQIQK